MKPGRRRRRRRVRVALGWILVGGVAATLLWANREPGVRRGTALSAPPAQVLGRWTTEDPRYADRALTITEEEVVLELGPEGAPVTGPIVAVRDWLEEGTRVIMVEYRLAGGTDRLEIQLHGPGRMRLRNPPEVVWTR